MSKRKKISIIVTTVLLLAGVCWWVFGREDSQMRKVRQMQQEMFAAEKQPDRETMEAFGKEWQKLSPDQQMELGKGMFEKFENRRQKEMDAYFSLPSQEEREKFMDNRIKEMDQQRKQMASGGGRPPGGMGPGGPPPVGQGGPRGPGERKRPTADQMRQFRTQMLIRSSPQDRARGMSFMADEMKRRMASGHSPMFGPPPGR